MTGPRVVVAGTGFGRVYLAGVADPAFPFELAGVLARGSERSRACAERYGVPLWTRVADLPGDVDVACVVVGSAPTGGPGARLAVELMRRGVHVLQEHPVHPGELAECLRQARASGVRYRLNSHHVHVAAVRRFIAAVRDLAARQDLLFVDAATSVQVLYTLFDVLGEALPQLRPWTFAPPVTPPGVPPAEAPFHSLAGVLGGVPVTLRVQHHLDPREPDNHAHLWHRITVGAEGGTLTLVSSNGPVLWCPRPHMPPTDGLAGFDELADAHLSYGVAEPVGPATAPTFAEVFTRQWPAAVQTALTGLWDAVTDGEDPMTRGQYHLTLGRLTQDVLDLLGPMHLVRRDTPTVLSARHLSAGPEAA